MTPADFLLRPPHKMRYRRHYCIYFHHSSVLTQPVCRLCHKYHAGLMVILILVSTSACWVLVVIVHIVYFRLWWWWQLLLLRRRLWPKLLLSHGPRRRRQHLRVGTGKLSRRRPKLLLLNWLHWPKAISLPSSTEPAALPRGVPRWGFPWPSVERTRLVQHRLIVPGRIT